MPLEPLADKWRAFGWHVVEIDGHDMGQVVGRWRPRAGQGQPTLILAHTIKGKGCPLWRTTEWHGRAPTPRTRTWPCA